MSVMVSAAVAGVAIAAVGTVHSIESSKQAKRIAGQEKNKAKWSEKKYLRELDDQKEAQSIETRRELAQTRRRTGYKGFGGGGMGGTMPTGTLLAPQTLDPAAPQNTLLGE